MPPKIRLDLAKGFTLYMVKAVIKRQGRRNHRPRNDQSLAIIMTPLHRSPPVGELSTDWSGQRQILVKNIVDFFKSRFFTPV